MNGYPFSCGNPLDDRPRYDYLAVSDDSYLVLWRESRRKALTSSCRGTLSPAIAPPAPSPEPGWQSTDEVIDNCCQLLATTSPTLTSLWPAIDNLVQRFEAGHRLYAYLDQHGRGVRSSDYRNLDRYLAFALLLTRAWRCQRRLTYLNALLKVLDLLCAYAEDMTTEQHLTLTQRIHDEAECVATLEAELRSKTGYQ